MKWSVLVLAGAGIVAALCAAVLVAVLTSGKNGKADKATNGEFKTIVAVNALPANSVVKAEDIQPRFVKVNAADSSTLVDESQVIGRITATPIAKGQQLSSKDILAPGSMAALVAAIPTNQRAVGVSLTDDRRIAGLLYPGCMVDVLTSFDVVGGWTGSDTLSTTLLSNVKVLGIEDRLLSSPAPGSDENAQQQRNKNPHKVVYLLVDSQQAEKLNLVRDRGVSLALRNPQDKELTQNGFNWLSDDSREYYYRIGKSMVEKFRKGGKAFISLSSLAALGVSGNAPLSDEAARPMSPEVPAVAASSIPPAPASVPSSVPTTAAPPVSASASFAADPDPQWTVTVIRAGASETRVFAMPAKQGMEGTK